MELVNFYLVLLIASCNCYKLLKNGKKQIARGREVDIMEYPYVAQYVENSHTACGAAIISKYWILTAAHCIDANSVITVKTGSTYRNSGGLHHEIDEITIHKNFDPVTYDNDIALIKLTAPIRFNYVREPIRIARRVPKTGDKLVIVGYGKEDVGGRYSRVLKSAEVPVISSMVCQKYYEKENDTITNNMFCAGIGDIDACKGDSGGPAVINGKLVGIISSGKDCRSAEYPTVYTKVYNYVDWITRNTGIKI